MNFCRIVPTRRKRWHQLMCFLPLVTSRPKTQAGTITCLLRLTARQAPTAAGVMTGVLVPIAQRIGIPYKFLAVLCIAKLSGGQYSKNKPPFAKFKI